MNLDEIQKETEDVSKEFSLILELLDRTENTLNLKLSITKDIFVQIYANKLKDKLNLTLVMRGQRLYGYDSEGGLYHMHPFEDPDSHVLITERKGIRDFVFESLSFLEKERFI